MPVHTYTNWNSRPSDREEQVELQFAAASGH